MLLKGFEEHRVSDVSDLLSRVLDFRVLSVIFYGLGFSGLVPRVEGFGLTPQPVRGVL